MPAPVLTPAALDQAAARLLSERPVEPAVDERAWQNIVDGYGRTAPASLAARPLLTKTVDELMSEALRAVPDHGTRPEMEVRLPGRLSAMFPERMLRRYPRRLDYPPSVQLHVAGVVLREWGWQQEPHHLRNRRGARCVCGAICTAVALGIGGERAAHQAAWHVLVVLRGRGWPHLIGDWNQQPGRTAEQAIEVVAEARQLAQTAGQ